MYTWKDGRSAEYTDWGRRIALAHKYRVRLDERRGFLLLPDEIKRVCRS